MKSVDRWSSGNQRRATARMPLLYRALVALFLLSAGLVAVSGRLWAQGGAIEDITGPELVSLSFAPTAINTTTGQAQVKVTVRATDDLAGFNYANVRFRSGSGNGNNYQWAYVSSLKNGNANDGEFEGYANFPQYSDAGDWKIDQVEVRDKLNNYFLYHNYGTGTLIRSLTPFTNNLPPLSVTSTTRTDTTPPVVTGYSFTPSSVDVRAGGKYVTVTLTATDAGGLNSYATVYFMDRMGSNQWRGLNVYYNAQKGAYEGTIYFPQVINGGDWTVTYIGVADISQNSRTYQHSNGTLKALNQSLGYPYPSALSVTSDFDDFTAPVLANQGLDFSPKAIDVSGSSKEVTVVAAATDSSSVSYCYVQFVSPNGQQYRGASLVLQNGVLQGKILFPRFSQTGVWRIHYMALGDPLNNYRYYYENDLRALNLPTQIQVSTGLSVSNATGPLNGTVTLSASLSFKGAPVGGKTVNFKLLGVGVGSAVTSDNGVATLPGVSIAGIAANRYPNAVEANFGGDATMAAVTGFGDLTVTSAVLVPTTTTLNLDKSGTYVGTDEQVNLTAQVVSAAGRPTVPAGTDVLFYVDGTGVAHRIGTAATDASGVATFAYNVKALAPGAHTFYAEFRGRSAIIANTTYDFQASPSIAAAAFNVDSDREPPVTQVTLEKANATDPEPVGGVYEGAVRVTLLATDNDSGVKEIRYRVNQGTTLPLPTNTSAYTVNQDPADPRYHEVTVAGDTAIFVLAEEGKHHLDYGATDNKGNEELATLEPGTICDLKCMHVTININEAPEAVNLHAETDEDTPVGITLSGSDGDGDALAYVVLSQPKNGILSGTAPGLTYTPNANWVGSDSFTYRVSDAKLASNVATVTITVAPVNDVPVGNDDAYETDEDTALTVPAAGVLANDSDADGEGLSAAVASGPAHGTLALNADGSFTYTPNANYHGADSFTYKAGDGKADSAAATVTITVRPVNDKPVAVADSATVAEDSGANAISVLTNDSDADGDMLEVTAVTQGSKGSVSFTASGVTYTPNADENGADAFTYTISDGNGGTATATVTVGITPVNDAPTATAGGPYQGLEGAPVAFNGAGSDIEGDALAYAWDFGDGTGGAGASPSHAYKENGTYTATLTVTDAHGAKSSGSATVVIGNVAPKVTATPILAPQPAGSVTLRGTYADPGVLDTHRATWTLLPGGTSASLVFGPDAVAAGTVARTVTLAPGVYRVELAVADDEGDAGADAYQYLVVYDPSAGFVTGGGWVDSPAGAFPADPTLTGRGHFGFAAKYRKGVTTPDGSTQFTFQAGGLGFQSTSYEWLVVSGARAQFKGEGTVNGAGGYGFLLTAVDGQVSGGGGADRFRIKIWEKATGKVVYDNQAGAADNDGLATDGTLVKGGSIVIHTGK